MEGRGVLQEALEHCWNSVESRQLVLHFRAARQIAMADLLEGRGTGEHSRGFELALMTNKAKVGHEVMTLLLSLLLVVVEKSRPAV